jgi:hypothetical protein
MKIYYHHTKRVSQRIKGGMFMEKVIKSSQEKLDFKIPSPPIADEPHELVEALANGLKMSGGVKPQGVVSVLKGIIGHNITGIPNRSKNLLILMGVFTVLWTALGTMNLGGFKGILIFLTGAYNNFLGKFLVFLGFVDLIIPAVKANKDNKFSDYIKKFYTAADLIKKAYNELKIKSISILIISSGFGLAFSNLLTRNNKMDKYFVCIVSALMIIKSIGAKRKNNLYAIGQGIIFDLIRLTKKKDVPLMELTHLISAGFSFGLVISFMVPYLGSTDYSDPKGYIVGGIITAVGVAYYFFTTKGAQK